MKRTATVLLVAALCAAAGADIPRVISYQGILLGSDEKPVPEGSYKLTFKLYTEDQTLVWEEEHNQVFIGGGLFHVLLGEAKPLAIPFDQPYTLGIQVGSDPELQPRMLLSSAPYCIRADDADKLLGYGISPTPQPNMLLPLDNNGKFPATVLSGSGSAGGEYLKKNDDDTSRVSAAGPVLLIVNTGGGDGINGRSKQGRGIEGRSESLEGVVGWTDASGKSGVMGHSANGRGVVGRSDNDDGVVGWSASSDKSGVFGHSTSGLGVTGRSEDSHGVFGQSVNGFGGYFRSDEDHKDLALGGPVGRINSDPQVDNSILYLSSNDDVIVKLDNDGGENATFSILNSGGYDVCTVEENGNLTLYNEGTKIIELGTGLDYAEGFDVRVNGEIGPGSVLIIDADNPGQLALSHDPYDNKVAGVVAGGGGLGSGVRLGSGEFDFDVALAGRVYCNVDATYGAISPGDLLTTSPTPGHAMAVRDHDRARGAVLGKAMGGLEAGQKGQILVLVTLQ